MKILDRTFSINNLTKAFNWILTYKDYKFKNYFRDSYTSYTIAMKENLAYLNKQLRDQTYLPKHPTKIYLPKPSGTSRTYTLITVEDQIVYQAFINIIAEYHWKKNKKRYNKTVFGHMYAGKSEFFFYKDWFKSYKELNSKIIQAYNNGYCYMASFDLTAFYDSIDHKVLRFLLTEYGIAKEFIDLLLIYLSEWTSDNKIFHGHGIPQGPMSSGLLSEVILSYIDEKCELEIAKNNYDVKYFRFVDDIKIIAKDEKTLRKILIRLDYFSKQIGLFAQSSKISIHRIHNIDDEIKRISIPFAFEVTLGTQKQDTAFSEMKKIVNRDKKVTNQTNFKRILSHLEPNFVTSKYLLEILVHNPDLYENITFYFEKYKKYISDKIFEEILQYIEEQEIYQIINGKILLSIKNRISDENKEKLNLYAKLRWNDIKNNKIYCVFFKTKIIGILLENNLLTYQDTLNLIKKEENIWVLKTIAKYINKNVIGEPSHKELLKTFLFHESNEVALAGAHEIIKHYNEIDLTYFDNINYLAHKTLEKVGLIRKKTRTPSVVGTKLKSITNSFIKDFDWKKYFKKNHKIAENKINRAEIYSKSDMSACINMLDVFNEFLLQSLSQQDLSLAKYQLGNIGGYLQPRTVFETKYPKLFEYCTKIHDKRCGNDLSHPLKKNKRSAVGSIKPEFTKPIEHKYIKEVRILLKDAMKELIEKVVI